MSGHAHGIEVGFIPPSTPPPDTRVSTAEKPDTLKQLRQKLDGLENCVLLSVGWAKDLLDALLEREEAK